MPILQVLFFFVLFHQHCPRCVILPAAEMVGLFFQMSTEVAKLMEIIRTCS
ncbi:hypothetical protein EVA_19762 [gut metagenome]|uniref:Uncharacterized protein n=1 Tax=gut metagenome TaxID=749906 RepID=J9FRD8_9ZZZZ